MTRTNEFYNEIDEIINNVFQEIYDETNKAKNKEINLVQTYNVYDKIFIDADNDLYVYVLKSGKKKNVIVMEIFDLLKLHEELYYNL